MPKIVVEKFTDFYNEDDELIKGSCSVETQPLKTGDKDKDKTEDKYDMGYYRSKYSKRNVDPNDTTKMKLIANIISIGKLNDQNFSFSEKKNVLGQSGRNETTWMMNLTPEVYDNQVLPLLQSIKQIGGGSRRARRPSRKYKKSAKRVFRKKSRSTRRR